MHYRHSSHYVSSRTLTKPKRVIRGFYCSTDVLLFTAIDKEKRVIRGFYCSADVLLFTAIDKKKRVIRGFYCIDDVWLFNFIPRFHVHSGLLWPRPAD